MYCQRIVKRSVRLKIGFAIPQRKTQICNKRFKSYEKTCMVNKTKVMTSKEIRKNFIDYFVSEKKHTYVHSSPVFLNSDPSLLFVNSGMNQFKSLLLDKTPASHEFYNLEKVVNSQKCIRISGKHNDLSQVGHDFHHHTFFEMLGNWSFGDYFKKEACEMAWELLTKVYGLPEERLYVTYFGGDERLNLFADEECKNIWLELGVNKNHIFPFGVKDNFWDMGCTGPCGPCSEIHYDFFGDQHDIPPSMRINAGRSDLIEIWNLVFIQYNRNKCRELETLLKHNVDTGMGLERLTAVLQGTMSNYDTNIFSPLFEAIQKNFNVRPYNGTVGTNDPDGIDTAYRIIADHSRMFTVAISDGLFPDSFDAGHILRKIIRKAAYMANCIMKTRPGYLSTLVPYVVETLDFFPELEKHTQEVIEIVNDEEKMLHQVINRGRKSRNRMAAEAENKVLEGKNVWDLYNNYGLDEKIIEDLATEIGLKVDWQGYKKINEKELKSVMESVSEESAVTSPEVLRMIQSKNISPTDDSYKYLYDYSGETCDIPDLSSNIVAIIQNGSLVDEVKDQESCLLVTDRTNFYSRAGGQVSDIGEISNKDFMFHVENVHSLDGFVFHQGKGVQGKIPSLGEVTMSVNKVHRHGCTLNHTATHLLQTALRTIFPYTSQKSSHVDPDHLRFGFSAKSSLTPEQIQEVEDFVNNAIQKRLCVHRVQMSFEDILAMPNVSIIRGETYPDVVTAVIVGDKENPKYLSVEPCCGTHVKNTADIKRFLVMYSKSLGGTTKTLCAVTGKVAESMIAKGREFEDDVQHLEEKLHFLENQNADRDEFLPMLKRVKMTLKECSSNNSIPFKVLRKCEMRLKDMRLKLKNFSSLPSQLSQSLQNNGEKSAKLSITRAVENYISEKCIAATVDAYKYNYFLNDGEYYIEPISSTVCAIFQNGIPVEKCESNQQYVIVADKTNFYAEGDGQAGDRGLITSAGFVFNVTDTYQHEGHIFHEGWVENGSLHLDQDVLMIADQETRKRCSLNHTACHLLHSSLKKFLPYVFPLSNHAGPLNLQMNFQAQGQVSLELLRQIEDLINTAIQEKLNVSRVEVPAATLKGIAGITLSPRVKYSTDDVPVISIGADKPDSAITSIEPCYGTHALNTCDLGQFVVISNKSGKNMDRIIRAVTGEEAKVLLGKGKHFNEQMLELEDRISKCLHSKKEDYLEMWDLLKEVKVAKNRHESDLPLIMFRKHQDILSQYSAVLSNRTKSFIQEGFSQVELEVTDVLKRLKDSKYIIHNISSVGDGRRLVNYFINAVTEKPSIFFAVDGYKTVICSCAVPQNYVTPSLSALVWIQPVATFLEGRTRVHSKNPELHYSIESLHVNKINKAMQIAKNYIDSNL